MESANVTIRNLENDICMLEVLYHNYSRILSCKHIEMKIMPHKTKIFQEIRHYNEIFQNIVKWFKHGDLSLEKENLLFKIKTIDKIYEYFCLFKLLKLFRQHNFEIVGEKEEAAFYEYSERNAVLDVANTYRLTNGVDRVTIYYEPAIYAKNEESTNQIDLYRIDNGRPYTPDFLIKYELDKNVKYAVLDSKYSKRNTLKKYKVLEELLVKYCISFCTKSGMSPAVQYMWLLQGRNDNKSKVYYFHNSVLSKKYIPKVSYGIYTLNSIEDNMEKLWDELNRVLFNKSI